MPKSFLNPMLAACIVVLIVVSWMIGGNTEEPNYEFLPGMLYSIPYDSFAVNEHFPDGKTLQAPIPGTIPRGHRHRHYAAPPEDAARAGNEMQNLFTAEADFLQRGAQVYATFCIPCHGPGGRGDGPVARRGYPPPPSLFAENSLNMKDGQIFHVITYGQGNMPDYAAQVSPEDRWKVILHIRSLQEKEAAKLERNANETAPEGPASYQNASGSEEDQL